MANYSDLIQTINDSIKANGNQEITGPVLNAVLQAMVSALGKGYQFMGVATPDTDPGTPDGKVLYLALSEGTYTHFTNPGYSPKTLKQGEGVIFWNGSAQGWWWQTLDMVPFGTIVTASQAGSSALIPRLIDVMSSGDVYDYASLEGVDYEVGKMINNDGSIVANANVSLSDYIELREQDSMLYAIYAFQILLGFFDKDKTFISTVGESTDKTVAAYMVPEGAKYIRINRSNRYYQQGKFGIYGLIKVPTYKVNLPAQVVPKPLVPLSADMGYLNSSGEVGTVSNGVHATYDVENLQGEYLIVSSKDMSISTNSSWALYIFKDNADSIIGIATTDGLDAGRLENFVVKVPENAKTLIYQTSFSDGECYVAKLIDLNFSQVTNTNGFTCLKPYAYLTGYMQEGGSKATFGGKIKRYKVSSLTKVFLDAYNTLSLDAPEKWLICRLLGDNETILYELKVDRHVYDKYDIYIPSNAVYLDVCWDKSADVFVYSEFRGKSFNPKNTQWQGRKIVWLGTSIPWGQTSESGQTNPLTTNYPTIVGENLGAEVVNVARPGMAIETTEDFKRKSGGSLSLSIAELEEQGYPTTPYQSYENAMLGQNADLYVFDCEPNNSNFDTDILAQFDFENWRWTDGSTFESHRNSYIGAFLFLLDKLWAENPAAKVVMVTEWGYTRPNAWGDVYQGRVASLAVAEKLKIKVIDLWSKLYYNKPNLSVYMNTDYVHPKLAAHVRMAEMLTGELMLID